MELAIVQAEKDELDEDTPQVDGKRRYGLHSARGARRALARILKEYMTSPRDQRDHTLVRNLVYGLSALLADYRKEEELSNVKRLDALEAQLTEWREHNVGRTQSTY